MNFYLNKYGFRPPSISAAPHADLGMIVVIPCFNEPDLLPSLNALLTCMPTNKPVEVIVVLNSGLHHSEAIKAQNQETEVLASAWMKKHSSAEKQFHIIHHNDLPKKHAGVGLARKIGMDEAVHRFHLLDRDGLIVCFDADSLCTENYLIEIEKHFNAHPKTPGCSIHYEHPIEGDTYSQEIYKGIINYELHLRYYNQAMKYAGLPYAYHTVGSSMAVRSSAYQKQGGMNKRKAGEDFYFIHKIIALGNFTELKSAAVIPSPRISDRVPFGTGKAIGDWIETGNQTYDTYAFKSFEIIKAFVTIAPKLRTLDLDAAGIMLDEADKELLKSFLAEQKFDEALAEVRSNAKTPEAFLKRFFRWFDAFKILKIVHFFRDNGIENAPIFGETNKLFSILDPTVSVVNERDQLVFLREFEKK